MPSTLASVFAIRTPAPDIIDTTFFWWWWWWWWWWWGDMDTISVYSPLLTLIHSFPYSISCWLVNSHFCQSSSTHRQRVKQSVNLNCCLNGGNIPQYEQMRHCAYVWWRNLLKKEVLTHRHCLVCVCYHQDIIIIINIIKRIVETKSSYSRNKKWYHIRSHQNIYDCNHDHSKWQVEVMCIVRIKWMNDADNDDSLSLSLSFFRFLWRPMTRFNEKKVFFSARDRRHIEPNQRRQLMSGSDLFAQFFLFDLVCLVWFSLHTSLQLHERDHTSWPIVSILWYKQFLECFYIVLMIEYYFTTIDTSTQQYR